MKKALDLSQKRFGFWIALRRVENNPNGKTQWLCRCECGTEKAVTANSLCTGNSVSCGCNNMVDMCGRVVGDVTVICPDHTTNRRAWKCYCRCGEEIIMSASDLKSKHGSRCHHNRRESGVILIDKAALELFQATA